MIQQTIELEVSPSDETIPPASFAVRRDIFIEVAPPAGRTPSNGQQRVATHASGIGKAAVPSVEHTASSNPGRKKTTLERSVLALSSDLAQASAILANRVDDIVNFASALPANCGREEAAMRISTFIESLYPASNSLRCQRSIHPDWQK